MLGVLAKSIALFRKDAGGSDTGVESPSRLALSGVSVSSNHKLWLFFFEMFYRPYLRPTSLKDRSGCRESNPQHIAWELKSPPPIFTTHKNRFGKINVHATHTLHAVPDWHVAWGRLGHRFVAWGFRSNRTLTQVPLAALCDKVKPSMLNHSRR